MPSKNPRLIVTLEPALYLWIQNISKNQGTSMSLTLRDIIKKEYHQEQWFWQQKWQEAEKEADEDISKKRFKDFKNVKALLKDLKS